MPYNNIHVNFNITYCYKIRKRCISEIRITKWFSISIGMKFIKKKRTFESSLLFTSRKNVFTLQALLPPCGNHSWQSFWELWKVMWGFQILICSSFSWLHFSYFGMEELGHRGREKQVSSTVDKYNFPYKTGLDWFKASEILSLCLLIQHSLEFLP